MRQGLEGRREDREEKHPPHLPLWHMPATSTFPAMPCASLTCLQQPALPACLPAALLYMPMLLPSYAQPHACMCLPCIILSHLCLYMPALMPPTLPSLLPSLGQGQTFGGGGWVGEDRLPCCLPHAHTLGRTGPGQDPVWWFEHCVLAWLLPAADTLSPFIVCSHVPAAMLACL